MRASINEEMGEISHFKSVERTDDPLLESSDETLAEMAKSNEQALTVLYRRHIDRIAHYVARHIKSKHDAEDVTSQVFVAMVRGLPKWKEKQVPFVAWLYRLATNAIYSWMRRQRFRKWIGLGSDPTTNAIVPHDDIEELRFALQQVPEPFRKTLAIHYLEQLSGNHSCTSAWDCRRNREVTVNERTCLVERTP